MSKKFNICLSILLLSSFTYFSSAKALIFQDKQKTLNSSRYISNYLNGIISMSNNDYSIARSYLSKTTKLSSNHLEYSIRYVYSLILENKFYEAYKFISKLKKEEQNFYLFNLVKSLYLIKNGNYVRAKKNLKIPSKNKSLNDELLNFIHLWLKISHDKKADTKISINKFKSNLQNIKLIQKLLIYDYLGYQSLYQQTAFKILNIPQLTRYHYFYIIHLIRNNKIDEAKKIINRELQQNPKNLIAKQSYVNLKKKNFNFFINTYDNKNIDHGLSDLFYLFAGIFQQQGQIEISKLYMSFSNYLNPNFKTNYLLSYENLLSEKNLQAKEYSKKLISIGGEFKWYAYFELLVNDQVTSEDEKKIILKKLENILDESKFFRSAKILDLANYYRTKKNYQLALTLYNKVEKMNDSNQIDWVFYYSRGICKERLGEWKDADKDLLKSIQLSPRQYSVINYLAYSWLERKKNIFKAKKMLEQAVKLSDWQHGYIIDSLGWAYYLLNDFSKAEQILQIAYEKTPYEFEIYDHYGDVLWKSNKKLQARYVWKNAKKLQGITKNNIDELNNKILNGID